MSLAPENAVTFNKPQQAAFERVRHAIDERRRALAAPAPRSAGAPDVTDQLRKLGELRDSGVLTQQEFDAKKAQLLERL